MHPLSIVSLFESQWSTIQMVVLREILMSSVRAGDPLAAWSAAARLLRSFYPLITPAGQSGLASSLANSAERLPSGTRCADPALPFIRFFYFFHCIEKLLFPLWFNICILPNRYICRNCCFLSPHYFLSVLPVLNSYC